MGNNTIRKNVLLLTDLFSNYIPILCPFTYSIVTKNAKFP